MCSGNESRSGAVATSLPLAAGGIPRKLLKEMGADNRFPGSRDRGENLGEDEGPKRTWRPERQIRSAE